MGDIKFACPSCGQKISANEQWSGRQINCPMCQGKLVVPQVAFAPAFSSSTPPPPPPPSGSGAGAPPPPRISRPTEAAAPPPQRPIHSAPPPQRPISRRPVPGRSGGGLMKFVKIGVGAAALCVGFYFGFSFVSKMQSSANEKRRDVERNSDGGQVGHIADLYDVLDKTDPDRYEKLSAKQSEHIPRIPLRSRSGGDGEEGVEKGSAAEPQLPVIAATWTLDAEAAAIPQSRVNGKIGGGNFVAEAARVDLVGNAYVLSFRQGSVVSPDRQMLVYLHLKPGETLNGRSWTITKDMKGSVVPQIATLSKKDPKYAAQKKHIYSGYMMKLEFGQMNDGIVPGKIFIALPDAEQTVVAGVFKAVTAAAEDEESMPTATTRRTTPMAGQVSPEERAGVIY